MITRRFLRTTRFPRSVFPRFYSQSALSSSPSIVRSPAPISRFSRLAKPAFIPPYFGNTITTFSTIDTGRNTADRLEKLLHEDGFKKWGFVIYRCTYQNNTDWENFMARFVSAVPEYLEFYNGLDLLNTFTPTVLEDASFEGATVATLREHFNQWAKTSLKEEQGVAEDYRAYTGRYRFFIMVDQEAMDSVLSAPEDEDEAAFVRVVYAKWKPEIPNEEDIANGDVSEPEEPIEGCTQNDVGWMKMCWRWVELPGFYKMRDWDDWEAYYVRPPEIGDIP